MEARIPFGGFYESMWSKGVDQEEEQYAERLAEEHGLPEDKIAELLFRHTTYQLAYRHIAERYALAFQQHVNTVLNLNVFMAYKEMTSPREYNFETDKIFVEIKYPDALRLARRVGRNALRKAAKAMFTSRDGFCSFYDPDISTWGPMRTWDYNQLYALMTAALDVTGGDDDEYGLSWSTYEDMSSNGDFDRAHDLACDHQVVMLEIGKLVGAKELAEELEEDDDGRRFPVAWSNTQDYVERYHRMNPNGMAKGDL